MTFSSASAWIRLPPERLSRTDNMILRQLQDFIGNIYDVSISHDVYDFLVTDRQHLPEAARTNGPTDEELIVAQPEGGGEIAMSLYLDPELLERLHRADPMERLHDGNV